MDAFHLAPKLVIEACERSLVNLNTDRIDLYQIHWPAGSWGSPVVPIADTLEAMNALKRQGKIRAIGLSNFNKNQIEEALRYAEIDTLQPPYSLFWRDGEREEFPYCREQHISILAYSPLAQGLLTGKFGPEMTLEEGDERASNRLFKPEFASKVQTALENLRPIAERNGTTLGNLALAWLLYQPDVTPIAGARTPEQARQNAQAAQIVLSPETLSDIDFAGRGVTDFLDHNPIMWT